jgi:hypothetical protein
MAKGPEGRLQKKMKEELQKAFPSSFWYKTHGSQFQQKGIPDLVGCVNGRFIGIEVKIPGKEKTLTKIQEHTIKLICDASGLSFMSTDIDYSIDMIRKYISKSLKAIK